MKKRNKLLIIFSLLIIGLLTYCLLAKDTYIAKFLEKIITININVPDSKFLTIIRNYLPDFVWTTAFGLSLSLFSDGILIPIFIPVIVGLSLEMAELLGIISGTFDIYDLLIETLASTTTWIILKKGKLK